MYSEKSLDKEISLRMPQMCSQNAANAISAIQFLKIFRGSMPPDTPTSLVPSALAPLKFHKVSATGYNSVSFIPISNLLYGNNGGMSYLIVHYVSFQ